MELRTLFRNGSPLSLLFSIASALFLSPRTWYPPSLSKSRGVSFCGLCAPISVPSVLRFFPHLLAVICATWRLYLVSTHSIAHASCRHRGAPQPSHFLRMPAFGYNPFALPPSPAGKDTAGSPAGSQSNHERCNPDA